MAEQQSSTVKKRSIRSFVKRAGRLTSGQHQALEQLWPLYGIEFDADSRIDPLKVFPGKSGLKLEIGFGNGESLVHMAAADPTCGYIGIEVHPPGVGHCLKLLHAQSLDNLKLMQRDAMDVLEYMLPDGCLDRVFLFFPDPWHKKKHHKRRIVNQEFRDLLHLKMKPRAVLHMATDWQDYAEYMAKEMLHDARFTNLGDSEGYHVRPDYRPLTKFEQRGHRLGHAVWDLLFRRN